MPVRHMAVLTVILACGCHENRGAAPEAQTDSATAAQRNALNQSADKPTPVDPSGRKSSTPATPAPGSPVSFRGAPRTAERAGRDWRQFRGPQGAGTSDETGLPTTWSATKNLAWKRRLPGAGASSPIVVGNRIYVTCYSGYGLSKQNPGDPTQLRRHLVCLDRKTGRQLWDRSISNRRRDHDYAGFMHLHGYASSTPAADGERVYAYFGNWGVYAFDRDGRRLWHFDCGARVHGFGSGASPVVVGKLLIVNASVEGHALFAIDVRTGKQVWRSGRITDSWSTPSIVAAGGRTEIVLPTRQGIQSFDAATGKRLWKWVGNKGTTYTCPSLVQHRGVLYGLASYHGPFAAILPGGNGDVSKSHATWTLPRFSTTVVSPVLSGGYLFNPHDDGGYMTCIDAATGTERKRIRPRPGLGKIYASPLAADGKIYLVTRSRGSFVFKATPEMEQLAVNTIAGDDSVFNGSPVAHNGQLLLRSDTHLYCIGR